MWVVNKSITTAFPADINLFATADWQLESGSCDRQLVRNQIEEIEADPSGGLSVILGDVEDADRPSTRSRKACTFGDRPEVLGNEAKEHLKMLDREIIPMLLPLAKTKNGMLGMLAGHHWKRLRIDGKTTAGEEVETYINSVEYMCRRLSALSGRKVPYLGQMSAWAWLRFRRLGGPKNDHAVKKLVHLQHGEGGGQTLASALNKLEMTSRGFEADLLIRAHDCKLVSAKFDRLYPKDTEGDPAILHKTVALLNIGSATRGYTLGTGDPDYVESRMMRPTTMGWGKATFKINRRSRREDPSGNWASDIDLTI